MTTAWMEILHYAIIGKIIACLLDAEYELEIVNTDRYIRINASKTDQSETTTGHIGWVKLIPGRIPAETISDFSLNLETIIQPAIQFAESFE